MYTNSAVSTAHTMHQYNLDRIKLTGYRTNNCDRDITSKLKKQITRIACCGNLFVPTASESHVSECVHSRIVFIFYFSSRQMSEMEFEFDLQWIESTMDAHVF